MGKRVMIRRKVLRLRQEQDGRTPLVICPSAHQGKYHLLRFTRWRHAGEVQDGVFGLGVHCHPETFGYDPNLIWVLGEQPGCLEACRNCFVVEDEPESADREGFGKAYPGSFEESSVKTATSMSTLPGGGSAGEFRPGVTHNPPEKDGVWWVPIEKEES